jgi:hypothetical protein
MSPLLLSVVSLLYAGAAIDLWLNDNQALAVAFAAYAIANVALILTIK